MGFAVLADHRVKLEESEKRDKKLDLARELRRLWKMKVTVIPIITGAFGKGKWKQCFLKKNSVTPSSNKMAIPTL